MYRRSPGLALAEDRLARREAVLLEPLHERHHQPWRQRAHKGVDPQEVDQRAVFGQPIEIRGELRLVGAGGAKRRAVEADHHGVLGGPRRGLAQLPGQRGALAHEVAAGERPQRDLAAIGALEHANPPRVDQIGGIATLAFAEDGAPHRQRLHGAARGEAVDVLVLEPGEQRLGAQQRRDLAGHGLSARRWPARSARARART